MEVFLFHPPLILLRRRTGIYFRFAASSDEWVRVDSVLSELRHFWAAVARRCTRICYGHFTFLLMNFHFISSSFIFVMLAMAATSQVGLRFTTILNFLGALGSYWLHHFFCWCIIPVGRLGYVSSCAGYA